MSTPRSMRSRASPENFTSLADIVGCSWKKPHPRVTALQLSREERALARVSKDGWMNSR
jgi:hypothetical protein